MSGFSPVLAGETPELRQEIESIFTSDADAVSERISELDGQTRLLGHEVTFGAEVEATFVPNPEDPRSANRDDFGIDMDRLYEEIVWELAGTQPTPHRSWGKGIVLRPEDNPGPVMINTRQFGTYNPDQTDIVEVRTAPAHAEEAATRYWNTIRAMGTIAERHGYMAIILATHINAAVYEDDKFTEDFIDFATTTRGGRILAAAQRNLNAMNPLQTHAGLQTGVSVLEAYPENKNASTAIQHERLEIRHPSIGIVDPRVDMLAVLEAVNRAAQNRLTKAELEALHQCNSVGISFEADGALGDLHALFQYQTTGVLWDHQSRRLVMPALLQPSAGGAYPFDYLNQILTRHGETDAFETNARAVRRALGHLTISQGNLRLRGHDAVDVIRPIVNNVSRVGETEIYFGSERQRVVPTIIYDSPEAHAIQRANIARSPAVRRIMGTAVATLTPAREALGRRSEIIESQMIEEGEPDESDREPLDIIW